MEIRRDCFYRKINAVSSDEEFMAALPDGMVAQLEKFGELDEVADDLLSDAEKAEGCELLERSLCPEQGCPISYLSLMMRTVENQKQQKDQALDGCDFKQI